MHEHERSALWRVINRAGESGEERVFSQSRSFCDDDMPPGILR